MCIIIADVHQFIRHCLVPLDPCPKQVLILDKFRPKPQAGRVKYGVNIIMVSKVSETSLLIHQLKNFEYLIFIR